MRAQTNQHVFDLIEYNYLSISIYQITISLRNLNIAGVQKSAIGEYRSLVVGKIRYFYNQIICNNIDYDRID